MNKVLIVGGTTLIGRNFVHHLVASGRNIEIVVIERNILETSFLSEKHFKAFKKVEFILGNLKSAEFLIKVFEKHPRFDVIFNFCTETRLGQAQQVYKDKIYETASNICAQAQNRCNLFVHVSPAVVYSSVKNTPSCETDELETQNDTTCEIVNYLIQTEDLLKNSKLKLIIIRHSVVYGPGDYYSLTPLFVMAKVYQYLKEPMKTLSSKAMKINTVHVLDVCSALELCALHFLNKQTELEYKTYNVSDNGDTNNELLFRIVKEIFGIKVGTINTILSKFVKLNVENCIEDINDKHLEPWMKLLQLNAIKSTPLSPFLDKEHFQYNSMHVNGSLIQKELGFEYKYPRLTTENILQVLQEFEEMGIWPSKCS